MAHVDLRIIPSSPPSPETATFDHAANAGLDPSLTRLECGAPIQVGRRADAAFVYTLYFDRFAVSLAVR